MPSSWTVCAMPLDRVRIGLSAQSPRPWPASSSSARRRPSAQRQAAQRAHEGDRLARRHRRIEAALLGQIADLVRRLERAVVAEQAALARRSGSMMPSSMRSVVVLPAPLGPSMP